MSALEDWYMVGRYEEEIWFQQQEEEEASLDILRAQIKELVEENKNLLGQPLTPLEFLSKVNESVSKVPDIFVMPVYLKGVFRHGNNTSYNNYYYDLLKEEYTQEQVKIYIPALLRQRLKPDSLVILRGMPFKSIDYTRSSLEIIFRVDSIVEEVKSRALDPNDLRRIELRQRKVAAGFKNVDNIIETKLLNNQRPKVALLFAQNSIVLADFENGKRAASASIDFVENRVAFTQTALLCSKLRDLDRQGYDAIALVRGGGIDSKTDVDKPEVIETIVGMQTPVISGVGHQKENIFLRQVADKWEPTPQGLGQYFSELVEKANDKRNNSRAVLEASVKKRYEELLNGEKNRNSDLQKQIQTLTKTYEETVGKMRDSHKLSVEALENKLNAANSKSLTVYIIIALIFFIGGLIFASLF
jgi:hypothetical protein